MAAFLDTNILVYYLTRVDEAKAERCLALLEAVERREVELTTTELIVAEAVWILESRTRHAPEAIRDMLLPVLQLPALRVPSKHLWPRVFDVYCERRIDFVDAYNAVIMERQGIDQIYSYDRDFDRIDSVERLEP